MSILQSFCFTNELIRKTFVGNSAVKLCSLKSEELNAKKCMNCEQAYLCTTVFRKDSDLKISIGSYYFNQSQNRSLNGCSRCGRSKFMWHWLSGRLLYAGMLITVETFLALYGGHTVRKFKLDFLKKSAYFFHPFL